MATREITVTSVRYFNQELFRALLDEFEAETSIHVNLSLVEWETFRADFVKVALHRLPVDVSVVGGTITSDLMGMNALRPFSPGEIFRMGGAGSFLPARWQSGIRAGRPEVWSIPWMVDIRMLYYWRDMLAQAGVDEATAFRDHASMLNTLRALQAGGVERPWSVPKERHINWHAIASWMWANGSDLFQADGKKVIFHEPAGLEAIRQYFSLMPYANPHGNTHTLVGDAEFESRRSAVTLGMGRLVLTPGDPNLGCTSVMGHSFLGGPDLVVWAHTRSEGPAVELVRFLTRPETQVRVCKASGLLPVNVKELDCLDQIHPALSVLTQAAHTGRALPCTPMIGLTEDRLSIALSQVQQELFNNPAADLETLLRERIVPLGNRTNLTLGNS